MMERSKETLLALIRGIDVANNFAFLPHRRVTGQHPVEKEGDPIVWEVTPPLIFCNLYVNVCTAGLGCAVAPNTANWQHAYLKSSDGQLNGWMQVDTETARQRAELGYPTVAAMPNANGHGHIALVVPADPIGPMGVYVSSAGAQNFVRALLSRSFGAGVKPDFFTHS